MAQLAASTCPLGPSAASLGQMLGTRLQCAHLALGTMFYVPKTCFMSPVQERPPTKRGQREAWPGWQVSLKACPSQAQQEAGP